MILRHHAVLVVAGLLIAGCSSGGSNNGDGGSGDGGSGGGGACKNVAVCTLIPNAKVNSSTGKMTASAVPMSINTSGLFYDECSYISSANPGDHVDLMRSCIDETSAVLIWNTDRTGYLKPMGTRADLSGVGDKAFYQTEPSSDSDMAMSVQVEAYKGAVIVRSKATNVTAATEAMTKQAMIDFTNTLLAQ